MSTSPRDLLHDKAGPLLARCLLKAVLVLGRCLCLPLRHCASVHRFGQLVTAFPAVPDDLA